MSSQTAASSLLVSNASVTRKCFSSQVLSWRNPRHIVPEQQGMRRLHPQCICTTNSLTLARYFSVCILLLVPSFGVFIVCLDVHRLFGVAIYPRCHRAAQRVSREFQGCLRLCFLAFLLLTTLDGISDKLSSKGCRSFHTGVLLEHARTGSQRFVAFLYCTVFRFAQAVNFSRDEEHECIGQSVGRYFCVLFASGTQLFGICVA